MFRKILPLCLLMIFSTSMAYAKTARVCQGGLDITVPMTGNETIRRALDTTTPADSSVLYNPKAHLKEDDKVINLRWTGTGEAKETHTAILVCTDDHEKSANKPSGDNTDYGVWKCAQYQKRSDTVNTYTDVELHNVEVVVNNKTQINITKLCENNHG
jgi:hypothetical protein